MNLLGEVKAYMECCISGTRRNVNRRNINRTICSNKVTLQCFFAGSTLLFVKSTFLLCQINMGFSLLYHLKAISARLVDFFLTVTIIYPCFLCVCFIGWCHNSKWVLLAGPTKVCLGRGYKNMWNILPPDITKTLISSNSNSLWSRDLHVALPYCLLGSIGWQELKVSSFKTFMCNWKYFSRLCLHYNGFVRVNFLSARTSNLVHCIN